MRASRSIRWARTQCLAVVALVVSLSSVHAVVSADPHAERSGWLGVSTEASPTGLRVAQVFPGSPAEHAGIRVGDVIAKIGRFRARQPAELVNVVSVTRPGQPLALTLVRDGATVEVAPTIEPAPRGGQRASVLVGHPAPQFRASLLQGNEPTELGRLRGRVVLVDFWATWCGPCRAMMPVLDALYRQQRAAGLSVIGISSERPERVRAHLARSPVSYTIATDRIAASSYQVEALPTLAVIDRQGVVRDIVVGASRPEIERLQALVTQLLAEPASPAAP